MTTIATMPMRRAERRAAPSRPAIPLGDRSTYTSSEGQT